MMRALSFQRIDTHNHPRTPIHCRNIFQGYRSFVVAIIAKINTIDEIHFNHHDRASSVRFGVEVVE